MQKGRMENLSVAVFIKRTSHICLPDKISVSHSLRYIVCLCVAEPSLLVVAKSELDLQSLDSGNDVGGGNNIVVVVAAVQLFSSTPPTISVCEFCGITLSNLIYVFGWISA